MHFYFRICPKTYFLAFLFFMATSSIATVKLPYFFSDNMVLQQNTQAGIWGWATPGKNIKITASWNKKEYALRANDAGKWKGALETPAAGGPYSITISDGNAITLQNVMIGEVWLCSGQSNMEMPMKGFKDQPVLGANDAVFNSRNNMLRIYTTPRSIKLAAQDTSKKSAWAEASPEGINNFSATAYYFGRILQQKLGVPVGLVHISYGGSSAEAWMSEDDVKKIPELILPKAADSTKLNVRTPTVLYNGMLKSFIGYTFKGCIWYQGESNRENPDLYEKVFPAMVAEWRREFGLGDFPFYYAQIAPYSYALLPNNPNFIKSNSAYLRDVQRKSVNTIANSGMIVLMDIGEESSIHPANKEIGGKRFAMMALAKTYGFKGFASESPVLDSLIIKGSVATLKFKNAGNGLSTFGKPLVNFEIAGEDKNFKPAKAIIRGGNIVVSSPDVAAPVAVRYAFKDFVVGEVFNTEGFPLSSFRTDNW